MIMSGVDPNLSVAEIQGIYGPFTFSEQLLQEIWTQGAYDQSQLLTTDGQRVVVKNPGKWNHLAGPNFKHARLRFGESGEVIGDVELHLRAEDWDSHAHARDSGYDGVALHVVLFPPRHEHVTRNRSGKSIPTLVLLPWLQHDLEEYAAEKAVEILANHVESRVLELVQQLPEEDLRAHLVEHAKLRWQQKRHFAQLRVSKLGWNEACHQTALEILGFRFNRVPMIRLASRYPLSAWSPKSDLEIETLHAEEKERWVRSGVRPANNPRLRLVQYQQWVEACPQWPDRLLELGKALPLLPVGGSTRTFRREVRMRDLRYRIASEICGQTVGGSRLDTMICDGFLPLLVSRMDANDMPSLWYHWFLGDIPKSLFSALRQYDSVNGKPEPICHGALQGLIGWILTQEKQG